MKILLLFLCLASVLIQCKPLEAQTTAILDVDGQKLRPNVDYYILSVIRGGGGGGLTLSFRNRKCPENVAQEGLDVLRGLPLKFFPVNTTDKVIRESTDMNIVFSAVTICWQSTAWKLGDVDRATGRQYVTTGGLVGNPGPSTVSSWFKIEKLGDFYKLVFCPSVCRTCKVVCGDLGVFFEDGKRWLGLSEDPFVVYFKKVSDVKTGSPYDI